MTNLLVRNIPHNIFERLLIDYYHHRSCPVFPIHFHACVGLRVRGVVFGDFLFGKEIGAHFLDRFPHYARVNKITFILTSEK